MGWSRSVPLKRGYDPTKGGAQQGLEAYKSQRCFKDIYQWLLQIENCRQLGDRSVGESASGCVTRLKLFRKLASLTLLRDTTGQATQ